MFGESESESPRVPSPWDSLISSSPSSAPNRAHTPSPLAAELIPRLVPESDDGNVEYKLQLLSPSPARFMRLVTQMKWRLLEGGGQAYYELGVADSGDLIGLPRAELEQSLETLEMMAGEIGASVIVVKEIEVPAAMVGLAATNKEWGVGPGKRRRREAVIASEEDSSTSTTFTTETETETEADSLSATDRDDEMDEDMDENMSMTVVLEKDRGLQHHHEQSPSSHALFPMDPEPDPADNADAEPDDITTHTRFSIDLEISSVFKPRPVRTRTHSQHMHPSVGGKSKRVKKHKHINPFKDGHAAPRHDPEHEQEVQMTTKQHKAYNRRQTRDRKREEKRKALLKFASQAVPPTPELELSDIPITALPAMDKANTLVSGLELLHVSLDDPIPVSVPMASTSYESTTLDITVEDEDDGDDDVFASPTAAGPSYSSFNTSTTESHLDIITTPSVEGSNTEARLIVEALVVRKMSLEEAFLDFGGFQLI
ncbi:hypothetical protein BDQ12DRAFT_689427 [Crucibulum laeve]|uniref:Uncharacterized protein n=1 Tax=Crucibulum laeve TaxID=68775 RepID=A0A5C3LNE7_9AGAR|nr:hypothetical protein BDQ12DRAFT_689427 [Crucibulum laeve]